MTPCENCQKYDDCRTGSGLTWPCGAYVKKADAQKEGNEFIREKVGIGEILAQLAEEAAELAQAALKYRRAITGTNPTPVAAAEALEKLREEIADVDLCLVMTGDVAEEIDAELPRMETKRARWIERLKEAEKADEIIRPPFTRPHDNGDGTFTVKAKPDCDGRCTTAGGSPCPHLLPDFGCEYDQEEAKA